MATRKSAEVRKLLTASEVKLVESSKRPAVVKFSAAQLKKKIALTRKLRDKWIDLATRQRRGQQRSQGSRATDAAARSKDKSKILSDALSKFEQQLQKVDSSGSKDVKKKASGIGRPSKKKRALDHRSARAAVRAGLEDKRGKLTTEREGKQPEKKKKAARKRPPASAKTSSPKKAAKKKVAGSVSGKKAASAVKKLTPLQSDSLNVNRRDQLAKKSKAKQARIKQAGLDSRIRGHVSARGKRAQARRDSR